MDFFYQRSNWVKQLKHNLKHFNSIFLVANYKYLISHLKCTEGKTDTQD